METLLFSVNLIILFNCSPFGGIPRNWKHPLYVSTRTHSITVPPSGGSLEIGNFCFSGNHRFNLLSVPPSGGSLEIGNFCVMGIRLTAIWQRSPFGGIPRNWKPGLKSWVTITSNSSCSPFGGIPRNWKQDFLTHFGIEYSVPPSGGSLEIGNFL